MATPKKVETIDSATELFKKSSAYFITEYQGLNVADITQLRKTLRTNKVRYVVAKNTLLKLAAEKAGQPSIEKYLKGPTAVAFSLEDPAAAAKALNDHYKDKELPRIRAFVMNEQVHPGANIGRLADLPSKPVLLSQLVSAVEAPFASLVGSLDGFFRELVTTIDNLAEQKKGAA